MFCHELHVLRPSRGAVFCLQGTVGSKNVTSAEKKIKVGINGFGRIGRNFLRCWHGRENSNLEVVALNDSGGVKQASHLLKYDTILGTFPAEVKLIDDEHISVDGKSIRVVSNRDPTKLPWGEMGVDLVIEGTGVFINRSGASKHLEVPIHIHLHQLSSHIQHHVLTFRCHKLSVSQNSNDMQLSSCSSGSICATAKHQ